APQQHYIGLFNLAIRACTATRPEYLRQTGDAGGVSSTVATINVVGPNHRADKLLGNVVEFVGGLGTTEHSKRIGAVLFDLLAEALSHPIQRLIPGCRTMPAVFADERLSQTVFRWYRHWISPKPIFSCARRR